MTTDLNRLESILADVQHGVACFGDIGYPCECGLNEAQDVLGRVREQVSALRVALVPLAQLEKYLIQDVFNTNSSLIMHMRYSSIRRAAQLLEATNGDDT